MPMIKLSRPTNPKDNISGIAATMFLGLLQDFDEVAAFKTVVAMGDEVTIADDHTFLTGKGFYAMELDYKKNNFEGKMSSDWGSNNKQYTIKGTYHGTSKQCAAFSSYLKNSEFILLVKRLTTEATPQVLQFGLPNLPARLIDDPEQSGTADSGSASVEFTFEVFQPSLFFYEGDITEKP